MVIAGIEVVDAAVISTDGSSCCEGGGGDFGCLGGDVAMAVCVGKDGVVVMCGRRREETAPVVVLEEVGEECGVDEWMGLGGEEYLRVIMVPGGRGV